MLKRVLPVNLFGAIALLSSVPALAEQPAIATAKLSANSHVCNTEAEIARLADNEQLQEMARALVEFKATKFCFILAPSATVDIIERHPSYVKFSHQSKILYTFTKYVLPDALTAQVN